MNLRKQIQQQANQVDQEIDDFDDPIGEFDAAVRTIMTRSPHMSRSKAVVAAARRNPKLYQAFLLETNPGRQQQRLLREKIELLEDDSRL